MADRLILYTGPSARGWHRLQTFIECEQRFAWSYIDPARVQSEPTDPLIRGTLLHLGLAHYYARIRETQQGRDPDRYYDPQEAIAIFAQASGPAHLHHAADMCQCVQAYIHWYEGREDYEILHVEEAFSAQIGGYLFTGRIDLVVRDARGLIWAYDHKGTGHIEAAHLQFYSVSGQLIGYRAMLQSYFGADFQGLKLNLVQHGNNNFKFVRPPLLQAPSLQARFADTVIHTERAIEARLAEGRPIDRWPVAMNEMTCYGRYGACPYIERCKWGRR